MLPVHHIFLENTDYFRSDPREHENKEYLQEQDGPRPMFDPALRIPLINRNPIEYNERTCIIIIENDINKIGLIVDAVNEVLTIPSEKIMEATSEKEDIKNSFVNGISQINKEIQLILDCDSLVNIVGDINNETNE